MSSEKREFLVKHLESSRDELNAALVDVDHVTWTKHCHESWTLAGCAEHILIVERAIANVMGRIAGMTPEDYDLEENLLKDDRVLGVASRGEVRIEAPPHLHPEGRYDMPAAFLHDFNYQRSQFLALASEFPEWLRGRFIEHPVLKKLDGYQWLLASSCHTLRHAAQLNELRQRMLLSR